MKLAEPAVAAEGEAALDAEPTHANDCWKGEECNCWPELKQEANPLPRPALLLPDAGPAVARKGPTRALSLAESSAQPSPGHERVASPARAPAGTAALSLFVKGPEELRQPVKTAEAADLAALEGSYRALGVKVAEVRQALGSTRAGGKIADSVWVGVLAKWTNYDNRAVLRGARRISTRATRQRGRPRATCSGSSGRR